MVADVGHHLSGWTCFSLSLVDEGPRQVPKQEEDTKPLARDKTDTAPVRLLPRLRKLFPKPTSTLDKIYGRGLGFHSVFSSTLRGLCPTATNKTRPVLLAWCSS